jgi:hypothetical protein
VVLTTLTTSVISAIMSNARSTLYLRGVPTHLVREAKAAAARRGSTLASLVSDSLAQSLREETPGRPPDDGMRENKLWYERNHRRLLARYRGQYVAVVDRAVVDHDRDFSALAARVFARHGGRPVFVPRVQEGESRARLRSPRRLRP